MLHVTARVPTAKLKIRRSMSRLFQFPELPLLNPALFSTHIPSPLVDTIVFGHNIRF